MKTAAVLLLYCAAVFGNLELPPQWSDTYTVRGVLMIPYAELREPFSAWYDKAAKKSRIDYYGGMVKTYQLGAGNYGPYGTSLKVAPITTEKVENSITCLQNNGSKNYEVTIQSVLPDLTGFKYIKTDSVLDAKIWQYKETINDKVNKYTMWIKYKKDLVGNIIAIPHKYEMKGYNTLLGSHYDHYYLIYTDYDIDQIDPNIFELEKAMKCVPFPGPGVNHYATFNPMKEFIHPTVSSHVNDEFNRFKNKHMVVYPNQVEHEKRLNVFRQNLRFIYSVNRSFKTFSVGVNHLADRTDDELKALRGRRFTTYNNGAIPFPYSAEDVDELSDKLPDEFDWRLFGAVSPVKDQSVCGSCWSFGTTGAVEGALFLANGGKPVRLSQQALIDCSWGYGNNGCDGGEDFRSYQWIMKHGIPTEEEYGGYLGQDGYCHIENVTIATKISGYVNVTANDVTALRLAIFKHGPISIAIDASLKTFSFYNNGVFYDTKCKNKVDQLDHAVLAVGYGILKGHRYWLVKNSWSNYWGNDGYILISARDNMCGVETAPTYVVI